MERRDVLKICMDAGFFLDKDMLEFFVGLDRGEVEGIIKKLKGFGVSEKILTKAVFTKYEGRMNLVGIKSGVGIEVLKDVKVANKSLNVADFVSYFRARFEVLRDILIERNLENLISIRRVGVDSGVFCVIGMVYSKRITKNKNLLFEIEDLTGRIVVLVNRENERLFRQAQDILLDDVLAFKVSGSSKMLFAVEFIYPDSYLEKERFSDKNEFVAFSGDFHVGSKDFLEGNLMRFVDWLNGNVGDERQRRLAGKVKYLVLTGNNIEGVGVYPGQENFLNIKGCRKQYEKLALVLRSIRQDVEIVMCQGVHDAVWIGEPQPRVLDKWGGSLKDIENLKLVSNPALLGIGGLNVMVYHGGSFDKFVDGVSELRVKGGSKNPTKVIEEILKRRHLAPVYGEMDIIPNDLEDDLVLKELPDVFVMGGGKGVRVGDYNKIIGVSTSGWKVGLKDKCKVPILNLKTKEVKILDFGGENVVLEGER